jgi:hypothetical protein
MSNLMLSVDKVMLISISQMEKLKKLAMFFTYLDSRKIYYL